ncbi:MAG: HAMP domain-containing histidine kinase, partial [Candidatus Eremiobacteraeota bacterium]|nr:HAMP domain-containing histidine kinase [Candidatus Eremiobacteraeota bacterium]
RSKQETMAAARGVERFLTAPEDNPERAARLERMAETRRWANRPVNRALRRFNRGPGQLLLIKDGQPAVEQEDQEHDWTPLIPRLRPGLFVEEFQGERWMVYVQDVQSPLADRFAIIRPWSPSVKVVRTLVLYQIVASLIVMLIALAAVSYFAKRLARPLEELREKTKAVGKAQVDKLEPSAVLEISDLQASFLDMSQRVEEAMSSQRRFVADASHELKTPLTAIAGMLELMKSRPDMEAEDRAQALQVAKKEADRMESLIADLLLLSRAQARRSGEKSEVKLAPQVAEQIETLKVLFPDQEFEIRGDLELSHAINPGAFSRVARNLLENSARYASGKPIEIEFRESAEGKVFSVKDRGPGIPEEKLEHLFERFYRTDGGRARTDGGHGLGLAIVKALVEEAGGKITCQSVEGKGSEFLVTFKKS